MPLAPVAAPAPRAAWVDPPGRATAGRSVSPALLPPQPPPPRVPVLLPLPPPRGGSRGVAPPPAALPEPVVPAGRTRSADKNTRTVDTYRRSCLLGGPFRRAWICFCLVWRSNHPGLSTAVLLLFGGKPAVSCRSAEPSQCQGFSRVSNPPASADSQGLGAAMALPSRSGVLPGCALLLPGRAGVMPHPPSAAASSAAASRRSGVAASCLLLPPPPVCCRRSLPLPPRESRSLRPPVRSMLLRWS